MVCVKKDNWFLNIDLTLFNLAECCVLLYLHDFFTIYIYILSVHKNNVLKNLKQAFILWEASFVFMMFLKHSADMLSTTAIFLQKTCDSPVGGEGKRTAPAADDRITYRLAHFRHSLRNELVRQAASILPLWSILLLAEVFLMLSCDLPSYGSTRCFCKSFFPTTALQIYVEARMSDVSKQAW